jgi:hypothetical protein
MLNGRTIYPVPPADRKTLPGETPQGRACRLQTVVAVVLNESFAPQIGLFARPFEEGILTRDIEQENDLAPRP